MNDPLQDERISAYLDGEMTVDEHAEFERLLADDPERRQLLDELRALSSTLGGLPKQELGDSFSQQVLRKAERVVLTQSATGKSHEKVFNVALSDGRKPRRNGTAKPIGSTVDVKTATYYNTIGEPQLGTVWTDPEFDPGQRAFDAVQGPIPDASRRYRTNREKSVSRRTTL